MIKSKEYDNGLRLIVNTIEGFFSVSAGVMVGTGSRNETDEENGLSHFIEHTVFKGTKNKSAFEISDFIDGIGAQINAFTSKELTCFYTKSTREHAKECLQTLADIFFDSTFEEIELEKEKGVIIEEINMNEDSPEDVLLDMLSESYFGKTGLGKTILGPEKNIKRFSRADIKNYMGKYYTADNVVISIAGDIEFDEAEGVVKELFADRFSKRKCKKGDSFSGGNKGNLNRYKKIEQSHIGFSFPTFSIFDERVEALSIANSVFGGGMSSRLFQKIREELGLCYSVYSYPSQYKDCGVLEIYSGVNTESRQNITDAIVQEIKRFRKDGLTDREFTRAKEQIKSSFVLARESTSSQMRLFGKYFLLFNKEFSLDEKIKKIDSVTKKDVNDVIKEFFDLDKMSIATLGPSKNKLKI